jgi:hypothetical protein
METLKSRRFIFLVVRSKKSFLSMDYNVRKIVWQGGEYMARSNESMPKAVYVNEKEEARTIYPKEAILLRDRGLLKESVLYCENYIKCGCRALVSPVNRGRGHFRLIPKREGHSSNCSYILNIDSIETRIRDVPEGKRVVLKIDDDDIFESESVENLGIKKHYVRKEGTTKSTTNVITRKVPGTRNEYIRNVSELIDLLNSENTPIIVRVLKELYAQKMYYRREQYKELFEEHPVNTFMVEGFLDKRDLKTLEDKNYVFAYSDPVNKPNSVRLMLVHNGKGKERFKAVIKDLLSWIQSRNKENRKLAIIKGKLTGFYKESNILVLHVKDIDIKYKKKEFKQVE